MKLADLLADPSVARCVREVVADADVLTCDVTTVEHDSRSVGLGALYVGVRGAVDGASFAPQAIERGAVAVASERTPQAGERRHGTPWVVVEHARAFMSRSAEVLCGRPTQRLRTVGITGTNGKTTTSWLVTEALAHAAVRAARLGTIERSFPGFREPSQHTTPEGNLVSTFAAQALDARCEVLVMEVSSHALSQKRIDGVTFNVGAFTNLTQDHLDFHGSMEAYFAAKAALFRDHHPQHAVIAVDDEAGQRLAAERRAAGATCITVRTAAWQAEEPGDDLRDAASISLLGASFARKHARLEVDVLGARHQLTSAMIGVHNAQNLLVALGILLALGIKAEVAVDALSASEGPPGRLKRVQHGRSGIEVVVDYAHTEDALRQAMTALRGVTPGRLIVIFGCGGDRDKTKRAPMGRVVEQLADVAIVTDDNPRTEAPETIREQILAGISNPARTHVIGDRRAAIAFAATIARADDTVLIAGKGHETYQIVGKEQRHFDDQEEALAAFGACAR